MLFIDDKSPHCSSMDKPLKGVPKLTSEELDWAAGNMMNWLMGDGYY